MSKAVLPIGAFPQTHWIGDEHSGSPSLCPDLQLEEIIRNLECEDARNAMILSPSARLGTDQVDGRRGADEGLLGARHQGAYMAHDHCID